MNKLQAMEAFARVVDAGTFTRAAEQLGMPKATLTTAIKDLEAALGIRLLNRTTRRVAVTADGAGYYERCVAILDQRAAAGRRGDLGRAMDRHSGVGGFPSPVSAHPVGAGVHRPAGRTHWRRR